MTDVGMIVEYFQGEVSSGVNSRPTRNGWQAAVSAIRHTERVDARIHRRLH